MVIVVLLMKEVCSINTLFVQPIAIIAMIYCDILGIDTEVVKRSDFLGVSSPGPKAIPSLLKSMCYYPKKVISQLFTL